MQKSVLVRPAQERFCQLRPALQEHLEDLPVSSQVFEQTQQRSSFVPLQACDLARQVVLRRYVLPTAAPRVILLGF